MIEAFIGAIGSGKSHSCFEKACKFADDNDLEIVGNIHIKSMDKLLDYCWQKSSKRLWRKVYQGNIFFEDSFARMATYENALILADELGILLNKRDVASAWAK